MKINDTLSCTQPLNHGVPQESVNRPTSSKFIQSLKYITPINEDCISAIQQPLWMTYNELKLNPDKIEFLLIETASKLAELAYFFPIDPLCSLAGMTP